MPNLPSENTNPHPFEIADARAALFKASESQRDLANELADAHAALADAEFEYRTELTKTAKQLRERGLASTVSHDEARGEPTVAAMRKVRDECNGDVARLEQEGFRAGADRRGLDGLVKWSMHRDLRVDAEPAWDPKTGELRSAA